MASAREAASIHARGIVNSRHMASKPLWTVRISGSTTEHIVEADTLTDAIYAVGHAVFGDNWTRGGVTEYAGEFGLPEWQVPIGPKGRNIRHTMYITETRILRG